MKKFLIATLLCLIGAQCFAQQEYKATVFGCKSDGITDNTGSIQRAIDFISEKGGGTLVFYVGRYVTGAVELKSNVTIKLAEAAVLVGTTNIYGYKGAPALVWAKDQTNVAIIGKGVIQGNSKALLANIEGQKAKGYLSEASVPALISFEGCQDARISELKLQDSPAEKAIIGNAQVEGVHIIANGTITTPEGKVVKINK